MRNINPKTEELRRTKISRTLKLKHELGIFKQWNVGMKMPEDYRKKLSVYWKIHEKKGRFFKGMKAWNKGLKGYQSGSKNFNWKGGITKERNKIRNSFEMRKWKNEVFVRDGYICQICNNRGGNLVSHHILAFSLYPDLRLDVNNGITLCVFCHKEYAHNKTQSKLR